MSRPSLLAFTTAMIILATPAAAQVQIAQFEVVEVQPGFPELYFEYKLAGMPDFDQRRAPGPFGVAGLPGNGGWYCVPTSTLNMFAYCANHGAPDFPPFANNWQSNNLYNVATLNLVAMGQLMGTGASSGTGSQGWSDGMTAWLENDDEGRFTFTKQLCDGTWSPTLDSMTQSVLSSGGIAAFAYGTYEITSISADYVQVGARVGGHICTLSGATRNGDGGLMRYRDPADDGADLTTQSIFNHQLVGIDNLDVRIFDWSSNQYVIKTMSAMNYVADVNGNVRLIDEVAVVMPAGAFSFENIELQLAIPNPLAGTNINPLDEVAFSTFNPLQDAALDADMIHYITLTQSVFGGADAQLRRRHRLTGQSELIASLDGATDIAVGRNRQLYVGGGNTLRRFDLDDTAGPHVLATITLGSEISDVAYNDATDQIVVLSIPDRRILRIPANFVPGSFMASTIIPASVPLMGDGSVRVSPEDGKHWVLSEASNSLFGLTLSATVAVQTLTIPGANDPTGFDFDDRGHMMLVNGGQMMELEPFVSTQGSGWQVMPDSPFAGMAANAQLRMLRSRTNFHEDEHTQPGWLTNLQPPNIVVGTSVGDCLPDFNGDGFVNGIDLGILLNAWAPAPGRTESCGGITPCPQDMNADESINGIDLGILLSAWGACD